jgi:hypothetical protein
MPLSGPKSPPQWPYGVRQPVLGDKRGNYDMLMDLWQATTQPHQYLQYTGAVDGSNTVFVINSGNINLTLVFADGVFIHPSQYTVTHTKTTTTVTLDAAPMTKLSITGM